MQMLAAKGENFRGESDGGKRLKDKETFISKRYEKALKTNRTKTFLPKNKNKKYI